MTSDWMQNSLLPFATLALGWVLSEFTQRLRSRSQRRGAIGRALAELLQVRYSLKTMTVAIAEAKHRVPLTPPDELKGAALLDHIIPHDAGMAERYGRALTELAESSPLLAFQLRGKEDIPAALSRLRSVCPPEAEAAQIILDMDRFLRTEALVPLE